MSHRTHDQREIGRLRSRLQIETEARRGLQERVDRLETQLDAFLNAVDHDPTDRQEDSHVR